MRHARDVLGAAHGGKNALGSSFPIAFHIMITPHRAEELAHERGRCKRIVCIDHGLNLFLAHAFQGVIHKLHHNEVMSALPFRILDNRERIEVDGAVKGVLLEIEEHFEHLDRRSHANHESVVHHAVTIVEVNAVELAGTAEDIGSHRGVLVLHEHVTVIERDTQILAVRRVEDHAGEAHRIDIGVAALLIGLVLDEDMQVGRIVADRLERLNEVVKHVGVVDLEAVVEAIVAEPDRHGIAAAGATVIAGLIAELKRLSSERGILVAQVPIDKIAAKAKSRAVELKVVCVELGLHLLGGDAHHVLRVIKVHMGEADKGHIHHRLIQEGYDQRQAVLLIYAWCLLLSLGAMVINQVPVGARVVIFLLLFACSALFAARLHLFEPVLRHHYNPKTQRDETVTPEDPAFAAEERAAHVAHEERLEHIEGLLPKKGNDPAGRQGENHR